MPPDSPNGLVYELAERLCWAVEILPGSVLHHGNANACGKLVLKLAGYESEPMTSWEAIAFLRGALYAKQRGYGEGQAHAALAIDRAVAAEHSQ